MASRLNRRMDRSMPAGSTRRGQDLPWICTGLRKMLGKNRFPKRLLPALGLVPPEMRTTKPGRSWFSLPNPYVTHEPIEGRPMRGEPVYKSICAGAWLNCSVYIDLTKQRSSACSDSIGTASENQAPLSPCCWNLWGYPTRSVDCW